MVKVIQNQHGRFYEKSEGVYVPSTSTIGKAENKPELNKWREKDPVEADRVTLEATDLGTEVHQMAEQYALTGNEIPTMYEKAPALFQQFKAWFDANVGEVLGVEEQHITEEYACTLDLRGILKTGESFIADLKTSAGMQDWSFGMQLTSQEQAYGYQVDKLLIIRMKKSPAEIANPKTKCQVKDYAPVTRYSAGRDRYLKAFNDLKNFYLNRHKENIQKWAK